LFHNNPPITVASAPVVPSSHDQLFAGSSQEYSGSGYESMTPQKEATPPKRNSRGKQPSLRDPINSITSDASFLTNPYAGLAPGSSPPLGYGTTTAPPGLSAVSVPHPSAFLIPSINFIPYASTYFTAASTAASAHLPGAHPLRLSTAIEYAAFLWDCVHDHQGARQLARRAIRQLREGEDEGVSDEAFEDAAEMVQILGRIMKRKSFETTPRSQNDASIPSTQGPSAPSFISREITRTPPQDEYVRSPQSKRTKRAEENSVTPTRQAWARRRGDSNSSNNQQPTTPQYVREPQRPSRRDSGGPPSTEGGPVGGIAVTPPRRRESTKSTSASAHRRGQSVQISPQAVSGHRTSQRSSGSSRRRAVSDEYSPQQVAQGQAQQRRSLRSSGGTQRYEPETPPHPPPKDPGYTPSSRGSGKTPLKMTPTRRDSANSARRVEFAHEGGAVQPIYSNGYGDAPPDRTYTNGNGVYTNGHYSTTASDPRGRGER
jgi:hypothetical protein